MPSPRPRCMADISGSPRLIQLLHLRLLESSRKTYNFCIVFELVTGHSLW
ncbi:hypothetical protein PBI_MIMI_21 [Arthrobacter phage Mimi]|nr:hypothetical protein PBI_MIMI_100 [Arthrobacter phage Mimi]